MPDKTPGERVAEEWEMVCGQLIAMDHDDLVNRIDTLLAEQSAGMVLDLRELFSWKDDGPRAVYLDEVEAMIRKQLPNVKLIT